MSQISTVSGFGINKCQSLQLKKQYQRHVHRILDIGHKKPNIQQISAQQKKISEILKKSKDVSRSFKSKEFALKCQAQNIRLLKSLSTIQKIRVKTERNQEAPKRNLNPHKDKYLRQIEIQRGNRKLAEHLLQQSCDAQKYRKKLDKQITQYIRIKTQIQRLKPIPDKTIYKQKLRDPNSQQQNRPKTLVVRTQTEI